MSAEDMTIPSPSEESDAAEGGETTVASCDAPAEGGAVQAETQPSALRDNLARKGKNSYYYAHTRVMDTPAWDGRQAPRRLANAAPVAPVAKRPQMVTNYAWANEKAKVKIYVPMEGCSAVDDSDICLTWEERCVDLEVELPSGTHRLHIPSLHDEITGATMRKKPEKIILTLMKKDEVTWYDLTTTR